MRFNLADDPWIVLDGGRRASLADAMVKSHEARWLGYSDPAHSLVVLRLMLAVAYRAYSQSIASAESPERWWRGVWESGRLPEEPLLSYFGKWRERFDLFGDKPFCQTPGLEYASANISPVTTLLGYGSRGEPSIFDSSRNIVDDGIPVEDAAVLLLFAHAFDIAGIKSTPKGALGRKGKQYPKRGLVGVGWCGAQTSDVLEGSSLFETIMLNLALRSRDGHEIYAADGDLPPWERDASGVKPEEKSPAGPVQALTWQSRRIRLVEESGMVTGCYVTYGDLRRREDSYGTETMAAFKTSQDGSVHGATSMKPGMEPWEDLPGMLGPMRPDTFAWCGRLVGGRTVGVRVVGLAYDKFSSKIEGEVSGSFEMGADAIGGGECSKVVSDAVSRVKRSLRLYAHFCTSAAKAQGDIRTYRGFYDSVVQSMQDDAMLEVKLSVSDEVRMMLASVREEGCREVCLAHMRSIADFLVKAACDHVEAKGMSLFEEHYDSLPTGILLSTFEREARATLENLSS